MRIAIPIAAGIQKITASAMLAQRGSRKYTPAVISMGAPMATTPCVFSIKLIKRLIAPMQYTSIQRSIFSHIPYSPFLMIRGPVGGWLN